VLLLLALAGLAHVLWQFRQATRDERFFAAWAVFGLGFHFAQVYLDFRYFTTLAPAFAFLAAQTLDRLLSAPASRGRQPSEKTLLASRGRQPPENVWLASRGRQ